uniref:Sulfatase-modifying factor enzyme-like domain-containing protein n=1 Tax=uncultured Thiotrichaceae bacterium TaxID=298394 RepID=A0A6S6T9E1_9GAMM|nr:MAG: Unknown protein [uncultured Thiotrichaceae bacterium]
MPVSLKRGEEDQLSALSVLNQHNKLVLTGDPGSGKSAFVNYLALCMAGEYLGDPHANINLLTAPVADDDGNPETEEIEVEGSEETEKREVRQPWDHGAKIPLRIILRDFSASEYFPDTNDTADVCQVMSFIEAQLQSIECADYFEVLKAKLRLGDVLVMFDGLDEVPQAGDRRKRLLACIEGFTKSYSDCWILVTCRPYAYQDKQWRLEDFADTRLAEFGRGQIIRFIQRWYDNAPDLEQHSAQQRAEKLQQAILGRDALTELAKRPLLLSLIAYLHANRHDLPERRADLYERLLELLIDEWEKARFKADDEESARERDQSSLAEFLQIGQDTIRLVLERLAFKAHAAQGAGQTGTADISAKDLIFELSKAAKEKNKQIKEWELCEYLRDRVGILYQRGGATEYDAVYTFPHRSFQEFLAASYFRRDEDGLFDYFQATFTASGFELDDESWQCLAAHLGRTDPDRWREVVVLLGGMKSLKEPGPVWDFLKALVEESEGEKAAEQQAWGLRLAAEILAESLNRDNLNRSQRRTFTAIQQALPDVLGTAYLAAQERVAVGNYLAEIGDPRPEVLNVDEMPFCYVPAGVFSMGGGKELHEYDLSYNYWIAQHPVTVAQFREYVAATGAVIERPQALNGPLNTPVVRISQQEAVLFCEWLTAYWQTEGVITSDWRVTLPNEPEWEKAARGGHQYLAEPLVVCAGQAFNTEFVKAVMTENETPERTYPWGNEEASAELLNYDFNVAGVTTGGIYPRGVSPYGCHDLSGGVWECTRSEGGDFPYPAVGTEDWKQREGSELTSCVFRGGAFGSLQYDVRCAIRYNFRPVGRGDVVGFRVVLSPLLSLTLEHDER